MSASSPNSDKAAAKQVRLTNARQLKWLDQRLEFVLYAIWSTQSEACELRQGLLALQEANPELVVPTLPEGLWEAVEKAEELISGSLQNLVDELERTLCPSRPGGTRTGNAERGRLNHLANLARIGCSEYQNRLAS